MNSDEVKSLLRSAVRTYLNPETIRPSETESEAAQRQSANIRELFEELRRYLYTAESGPSKKVGEKPVPTLQQSNSFHAVCIAMAHLFIQKSMYRQAMHTCLNMYHDSRRTLDDHAAAEEARLARGGKMAQLLNEESQPSEAEEQNTEGATTALLHRHEANLLSSLSNFFLTLDADPHAEGADTPKLLNDYVNQSANVIHAMLPRDEEFYFLIFNATIYIFQCCKELIRLGLFTTAAPYLAYCGKVMDGVLPLATVSYLPWRVRLYSAVCLCYEGIREYRGALKVSQHLVKVVQDLYELETSDVVPPPKSTLDTLQAMLLETRALQMKYQLQSTCCDATSANLSAAMQQTQQSPDTKKGKGGKEAAAVPSAADGLSNAALPTSALEMVEQVKALIKNGEGHPHLKPIPFTRRLLEMLTSVAVDQHSRCFPLTDHESPNPNTESEGSSPSDAVKGFAGEGILSLLQAMTEEYLKQHVDFVHAQGWQTVAVEDNRPTTAEAVETSKKPSGKPGGKKGAAAAAQVTPATTKVAVSTGATFGVFDDDGTVPSIEEFLLKACVGVDAISMWVKAMYVSKLDTIASSGPSPFTKIVVTLLHLIRSSSYLQCLTSAGSGGTSKSKSAALDDAATLADEAVLATQLELQLYCTMSGARRHQFSEGTTAAGGKSASLLQVSASHCIALAQDLTGAAQNRRLVDTRKDLIEDAGRLLVHTWDMIPFASEQENSEVIYASAARALMTSDYTDALLIGNIALTAGRILQEKKRDVEALNLTKAAESFLCTRQMEFVFNFNNKLTNRPDPLGEVVDQENCATLHQGMWLRTLRDIRTELLRRLTALRLRIAAAATHEKKLEDHSRKLQLMATREEQSHLYGQMSRKERRVFELLSRVQFEPPSTVPQTENKLMAWANKDKVHVALVLIEIAKCQPTEAKKKEKLAQALEMLSEAQVDYDKKLNEMVTAKKRAEDESNANANFAITFAGGPLHLSGASNTANSTPRGGQSNSSVPTSNLVTPRQVPQRGSSAATSTADGKSAAMTSPRSVAASNNEGQQSSTGKEEDAPFDEATEMTSSKGLSIYLVWASFFEACGLIGAFDLAKSPKAENTLFARFVTKGTADQPLWNQNPFSVDALLDATCNAASPILCSSLAKSFSVIAQAHALETPYVPDQKYVDDAETGLDARRYQLRATQLNLARCGNTALLGLELAAACDDQPLMAKLCHQLFNYMLPLLVPKSKPLMVLRPITVIFHVMTLFESRRWSDGPLQYLAVRTIFASLELARELPANAQKTVYQAALGAFQHIWPLVLTHPNARQQRHIAEVVKQMSYVDKVLNNKLRKPIDPSAEAAATAKAPAKGAAKAPAKPSPAAGGGNSPPSAAEGGYTRSSLYQRQELFFDDFVPVEYLELLDEVMFRVPGGAALCEQIESQYVAPQPSVPAAPVALPPTATPAAADEALQPKAKSYAREPKTCFPTLMLQVAVMLNNGTSPSTVVAKLLEGKGTDPFFSKVSSILALELIRRRQEDVAASLCTEAIKEIIYRHESLDSMQLESLRLLREYLAALGSYSAPGASGETAAQAQSMHDRLLQKLSRRVSELRRRMAFKRLRQWYLQYDVPFQGLLHLCLAIAAQREAEREKLRLAAGVYTASTITPPSAPLPKGKGAPAPAKPSAAVADPPAANASLPRDEKLQSLKEDIAKHSLRAMVLFNRCYRAQYAYLTCQFFVNTLRSLVATEPPSSLTDVLQQQKLAEGGGPVSGRSAGTQAGSPTGLQLSLATAPTKQISDSIVKIENQCKLFASEIIRLVKLFDEGFVNNNDEVECLQPASVKVGSDCLPENNILRRSTVLQMWLTQEGLFEDTRLEVQDAELLAVRLKIYFREQNDFIEAENWERIQIFKDWVKGAVDLCRGSSIQSLLHVDEKDLTESEDVRSNSSDAASQNTDATSNSAAVVSLIPKSRKPKGVRYIKPKRPPQSPPPSRKPVSSMDGEGGYQAIPFLHLLGKTMPLEEIVRNFCYLTKCLQYGQKKQSAVALSIEMNDLTKNHHATQILPYVLNLQNAMGVNTDRVMLQYLAGHREVVRTQKMIMEAHRNLAQYKESDAYRRAQLKLASSLQPSRRGIVAPMDADAISVGTSATGGGQGNGSSAYKDVVGSFNAAISYLRQKHSTLLLVGVLYELGHLHLSHRVKNEAERCWNDAVDASFAAINALKSWRSVLDGFHEATKASTDPAACDVTMFEKLGVHKALISASSLASLAMYIYHENQKKATEACLLASLILRSLVTSSTAAAPQRPWDHAAFHLDELFVNAELNEVYSEYAPSMAHGLLYVSHHLQQAAYPLQAVFVANVAEYLAKNYLRSKESVVYARLVKAKGAAAVGNFREALSVLESVSLGKSLPDPSSGCLGVDIDVLEAESKGKSAVGAADPNANKKGDAPKGKGGKQDDGAAQPTAGTAASFKDDSCFYDNSKPPSHPQNLKALESTLSAAFPSYVTAAQVAAGAPAAGAALALHESVAIEYGPLLSRQVLIAFATVLISLGSVDPSTSWSCALEASNADPQANTKKDPKAKDVKGGASQTATVSDSAVSVALSTADKIISLLALCKHVNPQAAQASAAQAAPPPKGAAAQQPVAPTVVVPSYIGGSVTPIEEIFLRHTTSFFNALTLTARGMIPQATEVLRSIIASHNDEESYSLSVANVPSFTMSVPGRFMCEVYTLLGRNLLWLQRWSQAQQAATSGSLLAEHCGDSFAQRELSFVRLIAKLREGNAEDAIDLVAELHKLTASLEHRGLDCLNSSTVVVEHSLHVAVVEQPRYHMLNVLLPSYDSTARKNVIDSLRSAVMLLQERASAHGLNLTVDAAANPAVVSKQATAVVDLHHAVNSLSTALIRTNQLKEAEGVLRFGISISAQYDTTRYPNELHQSKFILAQVLRQMYIGAVPEPVLSMLPTDRPLSTGMLPQEDQQLLSFFAGSRAQHHPSVKEIAQLLFSVIEGTIANGVHDYELLRLSFCEIALLTARYPSLCMATVNMIALAAATAVMEGLVMHNCSAFGTPAVTAENPTASLNAQDLPPAVLNLLEEYARRDYANQQQYLLQSMEKWQYYNNNSAAAQTAAAGAKGNAASAAPTLTAAPVVTLPMAVSLFSTLLRERSTCPLQLIPTWDSTLLKLRSFLQSKTTPFSLMTALQSNGIDPPYATGLCPSFMFEKMPKMIPSMSSVFPKSNFVFSQSFVANTSTPSTEEVEGEVKMTLPHVTLLLAVSAVSDPEAVFPPSDAFGAAVPSKGAAKAPPPKGAAAPQAQSTQILDDVAVQLPVVIIVPRVAQKAMTTVRAKAKALLRKTQLLAEAAVQLDEVLADTVGAPTGGKDAKAAKATGAVDLSNQPKGPSGLTPRPQTLEGPGDEEKCDVLFSFLDLIVNAVCGDAAPRELDEFMPMGTITNEHISFIARLMNVNGGVACASNVEVHKWALRLVNAMKARLSTL